MAEDFWYKLNEIIAESIYIGSNSDDLQEELNQNTHWISLSQDQVKQITIDDLLQFIRELISNRLQQVSLANRDHGMYFYLWFDEMACQLRFSSISDLHSALPFSCIVNRIKAPDSIIKAFLASSYHDGIPFRELKAESANEIPSEELSSTRFILDVYVVQLVS